MCESALPDKACSTQCIRAGDAGRHLKPSVGRDDNQAFMSNSERSRPIDGNLKFHWRTVGQVEEAASNSIR